LEGGSVEGKGDARMLESGGKGAVEGGFAIAAHAEGFGAVWFGGLCEALKECLIISCISKHQGR
jgi:hypothetical protein